MELKKLAISTTSFKFRNSVHNKILTLVVGIVNYTEHSQVWLPVAEIIVLADFFREGEINNGKIEF